MSDFDPPVVRDPMSGELLKTDELQPCPFCGLGDTQIDAVAHWTGMRSVPLRYDIKHWCQYSGQGERGYVMVSAVTKERARQLWNMRASPTPPPGGREGGE